MTTINRIAINTTINRIAIITTINRVFCAILVEVLAENYYYYYYYYIDSFGGESRRFAETVIFPSKMANKVNVAKAVVVAAVMVAIREEQRETCRGGQTTQKANMHLGDF